MQQQLPSSSIPRRAPGAVESMLDDVLESGERKPNRPAKPLLMEPPVGGRLNFLLVLRPRRSNVPLRRRLVLIDFRGWVPLCCKSDLPS
jgi:hypothetical protein